MVIITVQEFISSACIEHLDFLHLDPDEEHQIQPFSEKAASAQFRSLTHISPHNSQANFEGTWVNPAVSTGMKE